MLKRKLQETRRAPSILVIVVALLCGSYAQDAPSCAGLADQESCADTWLQRRCPVACNAADAREVSADLMPRIIRPVDGAEIIGPDVTVELSFSGNTSVRLSWDTEWTGYSHNDVRLLHSPDTTLTRSLTARPSFVLALRTGAYRLSVVGDPDRAQSHGVRFVVASETVALGVHDVDAWRRATGNTFLPRLVAAAAMEHAAVLRRLSLGISRWSYLEFRLIEFRLDSGA